MYTLSDTKRQFLVMATMLISIATMAQPYAVSITIAVSPPYSNHISDYTSQPGKVLATIINTTPSGAPASIYLQGSISSSGGIRVYTDPDYKMPEPITVYPGVPYMINVDNLGQIFNENHIEFEGITKQEVLYANGLPEDDYQICIKAFDYNTGQPLSAEEPQGCSGIFTISDIEPPIILQPLCDDSITASYPQTIVFTWTMPPGSPMNTQYFLKMVEILPNDRDPNDAFNSAGHPVFFEQTIFTTSFIFGPAQPALVVGKRYAFAVTAIDPSGKSSYRNNGRSEVCSFVYKAVNFVFTYNETTGGVTSTPNINVGPEITTGGLTITAPTIILPTAIKGKLVYKYAESNESKMYPVANSNIRLAIYYGKDTYNSSGQAAGDAKPENIGFETASPPRDFTLATAKTDADGNFEFILSTDIEFGLISHIGTGEFYSDTYRFAVVMIESPYNQYVMNPSATFIFKNGDQVNAGNVVSLVRSYELDVTVKPDFCGRPDLKYMQNDRQVLGGANVYLCRKTVIQVPNTGACRPFPKEDGAPEPDKNNTSKQGMEVVAFAQTGPNGVAKFTKVVWHHNPKYTYYLYADFGPNSELNYTLGAPIAFNPALPNTQGVINTDPDPSTVVFSHGYAYQRLKTDLVMVPLLPAVSGKVVDAKEPTIGLQGAKTTLVERYKGPCDNSNITTMWAQYMDYNYEIIKILMDLCVDNINDAPDGWFDFDWDRTTNTDNEGKFIFENLPILFNWPADNRVTGPDRRVYSEKEGYNKSASYTISGPLSFGEKGKFLTVMLDKGAKIKGRVIDGESGEGLLADFRFINDTKGSKSNNDGYFNNYPALKIPGKMQSIIFSAPGYLTDTLDFLIDKPDVDLGSIKIFTKKRRLQVLVSEYDAANSNNLIRIKDAKVEILNVTQPSLCKTNMGQYVLNMPCQIPLENTTSAFGVVSFSFENAGDDNNQEYQIRVSMTDQANKNYEERTYAIKIPYSQHSTKLTAQLHAATCIRGRVTAGNSPVEGAIVKMDITTSILSFGTLVIGALETITDAQGNYILRNVPVRNYKQSIWALKSASNFIGDSAKLLLNTASNSCVTRDFSLSVYNDIDITNLMGFPIAVMSLKPTPAGAEITGEFTGLPANDQFAVLGNDKLTFTSLAIKPGTLKNSKGVPVAEPVVLPVKTNENDLHLSIFKNFSGSLFDNKIGITLDKQTSGNYGVINGKVSLDNKSFSAVGFTLPPEIWLALNAGTALTKMIIPVIHANTAVKNPANVPNGFNVCNVMGKTFSYSFNGFPDAAEIALAKSFLKSTGLVLNTILNTNCNNITPANQKINLGDVIIKNSGPFTISNSTPLELNMGYWKLNCSDWTLNADGLKLNKSVLHTPMDVPVDNLKLTYNALFADQAVVKFGQIKLLGANPIVITGTNKGMNYVLKDGKMQWSIYASNGNATGSAAYIQNLDGFPATNPLLLSMIRLFSGEPDTTHLTLSSGTYRLYNICDFTPDNGTEIEILDKATPPWCKLRGTFNTAIPELKTFAGNVAYKKQNSNLSFLLDNMTPMSFNNHGAFVKMYATNMSNELLIAKGTVEEYQQLLPVKVTMTHIPSLTVIDIDKYEKIKITANGGKYFDKVVGGMKVQNNAWNNFWFEGEMPGMAGISENNNRLRFEVTGAITANSESIKVSGVAEDFMGVELVYDFPNSRLTGSLNCPLNLGAFHGQANALILIDGNGWYFDIGGDLVVPILPGIGVGGEFYSLIGDYNNVPPVMSGKYGSYSCLPSGFDKHITGILLQSGGKAELLSGLHFDFVLCSVDAGIDIGSVQRMWMTFNEVNTYGIALLMYGKAYATGSLDVTCTTVEASMGIQFGASGQYISNGDYGIHGCSSLSFGINGEQCLGALGICSNECISVNVGDIEIGLVVDYTNQGGLDFGLTDEACNKHCP